MRPSRRSLLFSGLAAGTAATAASPASLAAPVATEVSLNGPWQFRFATETVWRTATVPHTWQIEAASAEYFGEAFYEREFDAPVEWRDACVRAEFEGVFHSATVSVNGKPAGEHLRKGYTAFAVDLTPHLRLGESNRLAVRVVNDFDEHMLPRGHSSDWTHDGGIYRPVRLLVTPRLFIERLEVDAEPDLSARRAAVTVRAVLRNTGTAVAEGQLDATVCDDATGRVLAQRAGAARYSVPAGGTAIVALVVLELTGVQFWHFDHPHLYRVNVRAKPGHALEDTFGVRKIEVRDAAFYLNGEPVRLMGVERMAGSNPEFGMAEPSEWLDHDHADMRHLNCIYTRVHWPQDRRVLDYCDRHGILMQTEVPTWGGATFNGMKSEPGAEIMNNGLEQLREMVARDRNHPCLFSWGVCNEVNGQNPPAQVFARRMFQEAKRLDPRRLVTYASNSLQKTPGKDVVGEMDYVMWNEYYESWYAGSPADMARNLDEIHAAFPGKPIVISEYGWCACKADRPEGDAKRIEVLRVHDAVFRERPWVAGLIFFCYNDYRTHIGDRGTGVMKQRVHGVVDVFGTRKPSYEVLRVESSPVERLRASGTPVALAVNLSSRAAVPAYTMRGYTLRAVVDGFAGIPVERVAAPLPDLAPGAQFEHRFSFTEKAPTRVEIDVLRPNGDSAASAVWTF